MTKRLAVFLITLILALSLHLPEAKASDMLYLPNLGQSATGSVSGAKRALDVSVINALTFNDPANGTDGAAPPTNVKVTGGWDGSLIRTFKTDSSGHLQVDLSTTSLPTGANVIGAVTQSGVWSTGRTWSLSSGSDSIAAVQSGTWNLTNISGTISLPTGAATAAKQPALGTAGAASADVITVQGVASMTALKVDASATTQPISAASLPLPSGASTSALQTTGNTSLSTIATNTGKTPINTTGSGSAASATVSTVITATAPANAVGFILMNLDTSTANIRWAVGRTATTALGQQLQPGRDTGFVPVGANVSLIAESGTQNYDIQWVSQ